MCKNNTDVSVVWVWQRQWVWRGDLSLWHMTKQSWVKLPCREQKDQELGLQWDQARPGWVCWQLGKAVHAEDGHKWGLFNKTAEQSWVPLEINEKTTGQLFSRDKKKQKQ